MIIRTQYADILSGLRHRNPVSFLAACAEHYILAQLSYLLKRPFAGPVLGTISLTHRCNLACPMCNFPQRAVKDLGAGNQELGTDEWISVIEDFATLGTKGLGFTGGEPLLRDDLTVLLEKAVSLGMIVNLNTNALLLTPARAKVIAQTGIDSLNISFDRQHLTNDRDRKIFEENILSFRAIARESGKPIRMKLVLTADPAEESGIPELTKTALKLGIDRVELLVEQSFARTGSGETMSVAQKNEAFTRILSEINVARKQGIIFDDSSRMLRVMQTFYRTGKLPIRCYSGYTMLGIDPYGRPFTCMSRVSRAEYIAHEPVKDLVSFWRAPLTQRYRDAIRGCRRCCLNCQQELNLLFNPWWL